MKLILGLALFLPLSSFADTAKVCGDLKKYAQALEEKVSSQRIDKCEELDPKAVGISEAEMSLFNEYKCFPFNRLDQQLKHYDHDIALHKGIEKLKATIKTNASDILSDEKKKEYKENSTALLNNLQTAHHLELLLATEKKELVSAFQNAKDQSEFANACKKIHGEKKLPEICTKEIPSHVFSELKEFGFIFNQSNRQVRDLHKAVELPAKSGFKSYDDLISQLKTDDAGITADSLEAVKKVSEFMPGNIVFMNKIKENLNQINALTDAKKASGTSEDFKSFMSELVKRQQWQNKGTHASYVAKNLTPEKASTCTIEKLAEGSDDCKPANFSSDATAIGSYTQAHEQASSGLKWVKNSTVILDQCSVVLTSECEALFKDAEEKYKLAITHSDVLTKLRAYYSEANQNLITFRNYALEQLHLNDCVGVETEESTIDYCSEQKVSVEAIQLILDGGKILATLEKPNSLQTDLTEICKSKTEVLYETELCDHFESKDEENGEETPLIPSVPMIDNSGLIPQQRNSSAVGDATKNFISTLAGLLGPKQNMNPYMNNTPRYPMGTGAMLPATSQIIGAHMAYGFGSYQSTPGLRPYSSINSDVGKSSAYTPGNSPFFYKPIGW